MNPIVNVEDMYGTDLNPLFDEEGVHINLPGEKYDIVIKYPHEIVEEPAKDDMLQQVRMIEVFRAANLGTIYKNGHKAIGQTDYLREEWERVMTERELRDDHGNPEVDEHPRLNEWERFFDSKDTGQAEKYNGDRR